MIKTYRSELCALPIDIDIGMSRPVLSRGRTIDADCHSCCSQCSDDLVTVLEMVAKKVGYHFMVDSILIDILGNHKKTLQSNR